MTNNRKVFFNSLSIWGKYLFLKEALFSKLKNLLGKNEYFESSYFFYIRCCSMGVSLTETGNAFLAEYGGFNYLIRKNTSDETVFVDVFLRNEYKVIVDIFIKNKFQVKTMIDAGANVGFTSLFFSSFFNDLQIISLEPDHGNYRALCRNIELSKLQGIVAIEGGVTPETGCLRPKEGLDSREWGRAFSFSENCDSVYSIKGFSIDGLLLERGWSELDFLKMDIEGGEYDIFLQGRRYTDFLGKVNIIAIEIHDNGEKKEMICEILSDYKFFVFDNGNLTIGIKRVLIT